MGIFVVDKPLHLTSFDVVAQAKKTCGTKRVGHTGTLDPLATGVLVLATDQSTKLVQFLEKDSKDYLAWVSFGASTPTLDAEGPVLERSELGFHTVQAWRDSGQLEAVLADFRGPQTQLPPSYSAIHVNGQRAYDLARQGQEVKLEPRKVQIHRLEAGLLLGSMQEFCSLQYRAEGQVWVTSPHGRAFKLPEALGELPTLMLNIRVSSGTYIRSLARDIGAALGVPAHLAGLVRTRVGHFGLEQASNLEELKLAKPIPDLAALDFPRLELDARQAKDVRDGKALASEHQGLLVATCGPNLVAVLEGDGSLLKVRRAWV